MHAPPAVFLGRHRNEPDGPCSERLRSVGAPPEAKMRPPDARRPTALQISRCSGKHEMPAASANHNRHFQGTSFSATINRAIMDCGSWMPALIGGGFLSLALCEHAKAAWRDRLTAGSTRHGGV